MVVSVCVREKLRVFFSDSQDTGVVSWSYHERGSPQNDDTTRPSRWVSYDIVERRTLLT